MLSACVCRSDDGGRVSLVSHTRERCIFKAGSSVLLKGLKNDLFSFFVVGSKRECVLLGVNEKENLSHLKDIFQNKICIF